ncbi:hypothetical protein [Sphingomonas bacterium]|uniref:hypothetical protein n=1 Tax=Sphingomonas bacterium TaxID=1895847 RepID=UPI001576E852|nr:hypothetical protein [Sphingomonas bacterium]
MPTTIALSLLAAVQAGSPATPPGAAPPATAPPVALSPEAADERCLAAFAYLAGEPGQGAQTSRYGTLFFYGKLMGRDPGTDLGAGLRRVVADIAGHMQPEIVRCSQEVEAAGHAMAAAGTAAQAAPVQAPAAR